MAKPRGVTSPSQYFISRWVDMKIFYFFEIYLLTLDFGKPGNPYFIESRKKNYKEKKKKLTWKKK